MAKKTIQRKKGFTVIEVLVTISIFSIVVTSFLSLFGSAFSSQRKSLNSVYLLNNSSYISEYISRHLRMAKKDLAEPASCLSSRGLNFEIFSNGQGIKFINFKDICQEFYLENGFLKVSKNGVVENLTPIDVIVESLVFQISGESQEDLLQPKVTFSIAMRTQNEPTGILNFQTTISQRLLDVVY